MYIFQQGDLYGSEKVQKRIQREFSVFQYNGYDMIVKHIRRLEDLVKQSPENFTDLLTYLISMRTTLTDSIEMSNSAPKFQNFINWVNTTDDLTYSRLKKKLIDLVANDAEKARRMKQPSNFNANY
jgi:hypothetical protein